MIETKTVVICDRCKTVAGDPVPTGEMTAGYYDMLYWSKFANPGEVHVCDSCMWDDQRYIAVYGVQKQSAKEFRYGDNKTIHGSTCVNVEIDHKGRVVSVWYRCMNLPFDQTIVGADRAREMREMYARQDAAPAKAHIKAIVFEDRDNG